MPNEKTDSAGADSEAPAGSPASSSRERGATDRALEVAAAILARWELESDRTPLDRAAAAVLRMRHDVNSRERRWIGEVVYGTVRLLARQRYLLQALGLEASAQNLAALWATEEAAGDEAAALPPRLISAPIAEIAAVRQAVASLPAPDKPSDYLHVTLSFPRALGDALRAEVGRETARAAQAFNQQAPTNLRVNALRASMSQVMAAITGTERTHYSPWGVTLPRRANVNDLPGFRAGWFEVQEEASQLAALASDARPGQTIIDVGAGAGGKSLAMASLMGNRGRLVAIDTSQKRLENLGSRAHRAGVKCLEPLLLEADDNHRWMAGGHALNVLNSLAGTADCVFVDAPCTGSGVLRRNPDARWRPMDQGNMIRLQTNLLDQAAALVGPSGVLIYVTCAFEHNQDEDVITGFLRSAAGREFVVEPVIPRIERARARALAEVERFQRSRMKADDAPAKLPESGLLPLEGIASGPYMRTWPHRHGLDAFFVASLRRADQPARGTTNARGLDDVQPEVKPRRGRSPRQ